MKLPSGYNQVGIAFLEITHLNALTLKYSETSILIYMGVFILGVNTIYDLHMILDHFALSHICDNYCPLRVKLGSDYYCCTLDPMNTC